MDHAQRQSNRHPRRATMLGHTHAGAVRLRPRPALVATAAAPPVAPDLEGLRRQAEIEQDMRLARDIQQGLLLEAVPRLPGWEISAICMPARDLGRRSVRLSAITGWLAGDHDRRCFRQRSAGSAAYGCRADGVPPRCTARGCARPDAGGYQSRCAFGNSAGHGHDVLCHAGHTGAEFCAWRMPATTTRC